MRCRAILLALPAIAGVEALDLLAELGAVDVGVDLRRRYVFVAEEELDGLEVRATFEEGGGALLP